MSPWSLISPASRGIGLALARRVLRTTRAPVVATARKDLDQARESILRGLDDTVDEARLHVLKLDVLDETSIADAASRCKSLFPVDAGRDQQNHLRLAFLMPGILFPEKSPAQIDADNALLTFRTNALGPLLLLKHFAPFLPSKRLELSNDDDGEASGLPARAVCALMSARVGSISDNGLGGWYSYRASKAAVNQIVRTFDIHLQRTMGDKGFAMGLHPGTVKTGLSKEFWDSAAKKQLLEPDDAAEKLMNVVCTASGDQDFQKRRGSCLDYDGKVVPP